MEEQKEETPEKKEQKQKEEKAKEEKTKAETKAAVVAMTPMLKQFYELKGKHPDAVLLSVVVTSMRPIARMQRKLQNPGHHTYQEFPYQGC